MGTENDVTLTNQFGEESINAVNSIGQKFSDIQPAKTGVAALSALAGDATLADVIAGYNALLAALQDDTP